MCLFSFYWSIFSMCKDSAKHCKSLLADKAVLEWIMTREVSQQKLLIH